MPDMSHSYFVKIADTVWVKPASLSDLQWRLTYAPETITDKEKLILSSVIADYLQLIQSGRADRERVCSALRK